MNYCRATIPILTHQAHGRASYPLHGREYCVHTDAMHRASYPIPTPHNPA